MIKIISEITDTVLPFMAIIAGIMLIKNTRTERKHKKRIKELEREVESLRFKAKDQFQIL